MYGSFSPFNNMQSPFNMLNGPNALGGSATIEETMMQAQIQLLIMMFMQAAFQSIMQQMFQGLMGQSSGGMPGGQAQGHHMPGGRRTGGPSSRSGGPGQSSTNNGTAGTGNYNAPRARSIGKVPSLEGKSDAEKYDFYKNLAEQQGATVDDTPGKRHIVGVRTENHHQNSYDDRIAVIWKDAQGNPQVREFDANMEAISRYQGRYGNDMNGDGSKDLATLTEGTHSFAKESGTRWGNILRPTQTTAVMRDTNKDGRGDTLDRSGAGTSILFHKGGHNDTGSAGCQTMDPGTFNAFWQALGSQSNFKYTVVDAG